MSVKKRIFVCSFFFLVAFKFAASESSSVLSLFEPFGKSNFFDFGTDKIATSFQFFGKGFYSRKLGGGRISARQYYYGAGLRGGEGSYREDEKFGLFYASDESRGFSFFTAHDISISNDTRSIGLNDSRNYRGLGGFAWSPDTVFRAILGGGFSSLEQIGIKAEGFNYLSAAYLRGFNFEGYKLTSSAVSEGANLSRDIKSRDLEIKAKAEKSFAATDEMAIELAYYADRKDFPYRRAERDYNFETRAAKDFEGSIFLKAAAFKGVNLAFDVQGKSGKVARGYKNYDRNLEYSGITRVFEESELRLNPRIEASFRGFKQNLFAKFIVRDENNSAERNFEIKKSQFDVLKDRENDKDNTSSLFQLGGATELTPSNNDFIEARFLASIFRYDTPSERNNDDRDEFSATADVLYKRRINDELSASAEFEFQKNKLVYLKAAKSALNNANVIYRFNPKISYKTNGFSMSPSFEVLANYAAYDYEEFSDGRRSYSFRQLSYQDSIFINLNEMLSLRFTATARYFQRGVLFWKEFAESPQSENLEIFAKALIEWRRGGIGSGLGGRYYKLTRKSLSKEAVNYYGAYQLNAGPEFFFEYKFKDGSKIFLNGWEDFLRYDRASKFRASPNFILKASAVF